jgi:acetolactate synthase-1/3 small subunit
MDRELSVLTIVSRGDAAIIEQITKQLHKLIDVIKVTDMAELPYVEREMVLLRMKAVETTRAEVLRIADIFRAKVIDVSAKTFTIEVTGSGSKVNACIELLRPLGIKEIVRTGTVAMARAPKNK